MTVDFGVVEETTDGCWLAIRQHEQVVLEITTFFK